jgi:hypothetical protein
VAATRSNSSPIVHIGEQFDPRHVGKLIAISYTSFFLVLVVAATTIREEVNTSRATTLGTTALLIMIIQTFNRESTGLLVVVTERHVLQ